MIVRVDGKQVPKHEWKPFVRRIVSQAERKHRWRPRASGILLGAASNTMMPVLHIFTVNNTTGTETIPPEAGNLEIEGFGSGGVNGLNHPSAPASGGGGGGAGGYTRATFAVGASNGKTLVWTNSLTGTFVSGGGGLAHGASGSVASGTFSINTITINNGQQGFDGGGGVGGAGGVGGNCNNTNAGAVNTPGGDGGQGGSGSATVGTGGAGITGNVLNDGSPYGKGSGLSQSQGDGAIVFFYT